MAILPKAIYRFSAIPIKLPMVFFTRTRTNNFTICMEIQKPQIAKVILRKKNGTGIAKVILRKKNGTCLTSGSTTKPQSSRQYGTAIKTEI